LSRQTDVNHVISVCIWVTIYVFLGCIIVSLYCFKLASMKVLQYDILWCIVTANLHLRNTLTYLCNIVLPAEDVS